MIVKLYVDYIILVKKSNLQTLCERCNKIEKDFEDNMICPLCGNKLVNRNNQYGLFIGCSKYPKCRYKR